MSGSFGDAGPDDTYVAGNVPDAEHVARRLHELRRERSREQIDWDDLDEHERALLVAIIGALLAWLRREGTDV
jgi:hypothetical protein